MWIKLCLLLLYICLLFVLSRLLEAISWSDISSSRVLSYQLLNPMRLSVAKLKFILDYRGVSYDGIVEKSELTSLVEASGPVNMADVDMTCQEEATLSETNFTSGAHFIEQVEDAKDSVWLVQVVTQTDQIKMVMNKRWKSIQMKASRFGVRTGLLDCSLDVGYCYSKGWKTPVMLLALPRVFEKKANVIMYNYSGPATESAVMRWLHEKLDTKITRIKDVLQLQEEQPLSLKSLRPEIQAVLFTHAISVPLFFSALSVKFPGRVKFGIVSVDDSRTRKSFLKKLTKKFNDMQFPKLIIYTTEGNYTYGLRKGEKFSFNNMEIFLKFLYPCLNDVFIVSFCIANVLSWFEFFISNCGILKRIRKVIWCVFKYNIMVIMLWLPVIGIFQMPYLDQIPLVLLKLHRIFTMSDFGAMLRGDFIFFVDNPSYTYPSFIVYLVVVTILCKKLRQVEDDSQDWFNFRHMQTFTHLRANNLFEPMRGVSSYDLVGGMDVFGSQFTQHSLWLQPSIPLEYIQHLPTWRYEPQTLASRAAQNVLKVESAMANNVSTAANSSTSMSPQAQVSKSKGYLSLTEKCKSCQAGPTSQQINETVPPESDRLTHCSCSSSTTANKEVCCSQGHLNLVESGGISLCKNCLQQGCSCASCPSSHTVSTSERESLTTHAVNHCTCNIQRSMKSSQPHASSHSSTTNHSPVFGTNPLQPNILPNGFRQGFMESHQCVICLDDYIPHSMLCGLPCGHVFHETCIISWLNREKHFCPMCRWPSYKLVASANPTASMP